MKTEPCAHCGTPVATTGPQPALGVRFCSDRDCRAAKARAIYRKKRGDYQVADTEECANCGKPVSSTGSTPELGVRYCAYDPRCRAAKKRALYALKRSQLGLPDELEDRPCSCCGVQLPERTKRVTDSPLGRWCPRAKCRADRRRVVDPANFDRYRYEYAVIHEARARLAAAPIEDCSACGFKRGRVGYLHPFPDGSAGFCLDQGDEMPPRMPMGFEEMFGEGGTHA